MLGKTYCTPGFNDFSTAESSLVVRGENIRHLSCTAGTELTSSLEAGNNIPIVGVIPNEKDKMLRRTYSSLDLNDFLVTECLLVIGKRNLGPFRQVWVEKLALNSPA